MTRDLLNSHQRQALAITLRQLERTLRGIVRDLSNEEQAILYRSVITLPEERRPEVKHLAETALERIAWLARRFELPQKTYDNSASLRGPLALLRSDLHDAHAAKLKRFGEVDPALETELDPSLDELIAILFEITRLSQK